jgi:hypothetical protein
LKQLHALERKGTEDVFNTWSALLEEYKKEIKSVRNEQENPKAARADFD